MQSRDWIVLFVLLVVVFIVTDCSSGKTRYCEGVVRHHEYQPAYWSGSGDDRKHHEAEYHLMVYIPKPEHAVDLEVSLLYYSRYENGDHLMVGERCGQWTHYPWLKWIATNQPANQATSNY